MLPEDVEKVVLRKTASPHGLGRGFGVQGGDYTILVSGQAVGVIEGIDMHTWRLMLNELPGRTWLFASRKDARQKAIQVLLMPSATC